MFTSDKTRRTQGMLVSSCPILPNLRARKILLLIFGKDRQGEKKKKDQAKHIIKPSVKWTMKQHRQQRLLTFLAVARGPGCRLASLGEALAMPDWHLLQMKRFSSGRANAEVTDLSAVDYALLPSAFQICLNQNCQAGESVPPPFKKGKPGIVRTCHPAAELTMSFLVYSALPDFIIW